MLREITLFLCKDASGWRVVPDDEVNRLILTGDKRINENWRVLKIAVESPDVQWVGIHNLREDLDRILVQNLTRRVNDDMEDPMSVAEDEAAHLERVECEFISRLA